MQIMEVEDLYTKYIELIQNAPLYEFIEFAKQYDFKIISKSTFYNHICDLIRQRLDREGLSHDFIETNK